MVVNGSEVLLVLLKLPGTCGNEVVGSEWFNEVEDQEGGYCNVKWQDRLHTMHYVE